ncbi:MAG: PqqD family protein [Sciscionella sp.]
MKLRLRTEDLEWREIDDDIVILDAHDATYLTLNGSGALLWRMLAISATREELVKALLDQYTGADATAEADTDTFLDALREQGLLAA